MCDFPYLCGKYVPKMKDISRSIVQGGKICDLGCITLKKLRKIIIQGHVKHISTQNSFLGLI